MGKERNEWDEMEGPSLIEISKKKKALPDKPENDSGSYCCIIISGENIFRLL